MYTEQGGRADDDVDVGNVTMDLPARRRVRPLS